MVGRYSVVGIATSYVLDGPVIGSRGGRGRDFAHLSSSALGPTQAPIQWVPILYREARRPGRGVDHSPHLAPSFKKE